MQVRGNGRPTEFFSDDAFQREDETDDGQFYQNPRFVNHIDDKAISTISELYGSLIQPGMDVLDLMSAWRSHVPDNKGLNALVGLGMNAEEMADNPQLTDYRVHDLNVHPKLPFEDNSFDLVICTVSVEYLIHPDDVFVDVARVLRPGGTFVLTFSNRWFPPKAIRVWSDLHEFERVGLVLEYFLRTGKFNGLNTFSSRGWPRPETDKYYPEIFTSDPVYAVWGKTTI
jgi:SAM-dependent methyltransferase